MQITTTTQVTKRITLTENEVKEAILNYINDASIKSGDISFQCRYDMLREVIIVTKQTTTE